VLIANRQGTMAHVPHGLEPFIDVRSRPFLLQSLSVQCATVLNNSINVVGAADRTIFAK
jgi:hypothetical protein